MRTAGIDIGSRTVKLAILEDGRLRAARKRENSFDPLAVCRELLDGERFDRMVATGYGRHLFAREIAARTVSELTAAATGARWLLPSCRTVIDIGGQDTKALSLDDSGRLLRFEMNDKCAAGTGRFLEVIALALAARVSEFGALAASAAGSCPVSSTCTVFAESEVVSLIARGVPRNQIALGVTESIALRAASLAHKAGVFPDVLFTGGVALNPAVQRALEARLHVAVQVPDDPQIVTAIGCALLAASSPADLDASPA
ncbi:MAG: acyl-CoA dehydratase activase [Acidobacteriota bacterium]|nr:acyl-CoA dehydratase activase [Acidobacteriota bacterium]